jgi:threonine/homoserine/homoserine lactone efflux protein
MKKIISLGVVLGFAPVVALAADAYSIIATVNSILSWIIPVLITLAVIYFIWGVIQYLISGDEEKKKKARGMIISGLIGLFVIVAFWGIIRLITNTFQVGPEQLNKNAIPCIPGPGVTC